MKRRYECPECLRVARWTDGMVRATGDERDEFWCQTCGAEVPLQDCREVTSCETCWGSGIILLTLSLDSRPPLGFIRRDCPNCGGTGVAA